MGYDKALGSSFNRVQGRPFLGCQERTFELWLQSRKNSPMCGMGADGSWQKEPSASAKDLRYMNQLCGLKKGQFSAGNRVG